MEGAGWIAAIIMGGIAGCFASIFMKSNMSLLMYIVQGVVTRSKAVAAHLNVRCDQSMFRDLLCRARLLP